MPIGKGNQFAVRHTETPIGLATGFRWNRAQCWGRVAIRPARSGINRFIFAGMGGLGSAPNILPRTVAWIHHAPGLKFAQSVTIDFRALTLGVTPEWPPNIW